MRLLTFPEAAEHCGVNVKTLRKHAKEGGLATVKTPLGVRVSEESLMPYLEVKAGRQEPSETIEDRQEPNQGGEAEAGGDRDGPSEAPTDHFGSDQERPQQTVVDHEKPQGADSCSIPVGVHLAALKLVESALERADRAEVKVEEQRSRAELAERQRLALEMQLRQYQLALADQAESLAEAYARQQAAELKLESMRAPIDQAETRVGNIDLPLRVATRKPGFGQRLKRWLGFSEAVGL